MTTTDGRHDQTVVPAMFEHAAAVYSRMCESAVELDEYPDMSVYEGHLTKVFKDLRLSTPYYTAIKNHLAAMGCIEQVRRGGGTAESRWILWKEPTLEEWKLVDGSRPRRGNKVTMLERQVKDLMHIVAVCQRNITNLDARVEALEARFPEPEEGNAMPKWAQGDDR